MLVAEIHGKFVKEVQGSEDYLTSAVFSHLRYIPPGPFWESLFKRASGIPRVDGSEPALVDFIEKQECFESLSVHFWPKHTVLGEPDFLFVFTGPEVRPLLIVFEAKLWSGKSGSGEADQLLRYLQMLDDLPKFGMKLDPSYDRFLVYLTPRDSLAEVEDSLAQPQCRQADRDRVFRLRWQDIVRAAASCSPLSSEPSKTILADVMRFLQRRGLEYFNGLREIQGLSLIDVANWGRARQQHYALAQLESLSSIVVEKGDWAC